MLLVPDHEHGQAVWQAAAGEQGFPRSESEIHPATLKILLTLDVNFVSVDVTLLAAKLSHKV